MPEKIIFDFFKKNNIEYRLFEHQPVFTVHEKLLITTVDGIPSTEPIPEPHFKTLFLKDAKGAFFLASVIDNKRVDLNALNALLGCGRFHFGKAEELLELLELTPGSVTPFGLIFNQQNKIKFIFDEDALNNQFVSFHPLRNDMTVVLTVQAFLDSMGKMNHKPQVVKIPVK